MSGVEQRPGQEKGIGLDLANKTVTLYHITCSDFCSDYVFYSLRWGEGAGKGVRAKSVRF